MRGYHGMVLAPRSPMDFRKERQTARRCRERLKAASR